MSDAAYPAAAGARSRSAAPRGRLLDGPAGLAPTRRLSGKRIMIYGGLLIFSAYYLLPLWVMVMTSLKGMPEIRMGNIFAPPVEITFESVPEAKASGRITFIAPAAGKSAGGSGSAGSGMGGGGGGSSARDFPLQIEIEQSHPRVRPGMTARVHIVTATVKDALSVEHNLVFNDNETGEWFVFARSPEPKAAPVKTKVELGVRDDLHVEIKSGLAETAEISRERPPGVKFGQDK